MRAAAPAVEPPADALSPGPEEIIPLPANALVMLVGASASGKSSWARAHFGETQIVSSDHCRALVSDDEANQSVNRQAFAVFYELIWQRLSLSRFTVADSTALSSRVRGRLREIAERHGAPVHAVVIHAPLPKLLRNNAGRGRNVPAHVLESHSESLRTLLRERRLETEGYQAVHYIASPDLARTRPRITAPVAAPVAAPGAGTPEQMAGNRTAPEG